MLGLLRSILETIILLVNFLINIILGLINFLLMIPTYITFITSLISVVPAFAQVFFSAGIILTVILFMINRQEG